MNIAPEWRLAVTRDESLHPIQQLVHLQNQPCLTALRGESKPELNLVQPG